MASTRAPAKNAALPQFDPAEPELRRDPYPTYRRMRETAPAWQSPDGTIWFTRSHDCVALFHSPALSYTLVPGNYQAPSGDPAARDEQLRRLGRHRTLQNADPPEHTRLRSLINRAFTPRTAEASRPVIDDVVSALVADFDGSSVDLVSQLATPLPLLVICTMLGIPVHDRAAFLEIGDAVGRSVDPDVPLDERLDALDRMRAFIAGLVETRRRMPGDDLMTRLIEATDDGRLANEDELLANTGVLLIAGFETTANLITNATYQLLTHPAQLAHLRAEPAAIVTCIEEVLRYDPPTQFVRPRSIAADTEIGGVTLRRGDAVVPLLAAANRDPMEFDDPETFDITRPVNRHLSFGVGHHLCIGASLARTEAQTAVLRLVQQFPRLALGPEEPVRRPNLQLRGFAKLRVSI